MDPRSALWREFARIIGDLRPRMVLIENVAQLRTRGLEVVLICLRALGYVVEWDVISAAACGGRHLRERIWIVARLPHVVRDDVYGEPTGKIVKLGEKLPRAGRMDRDGMISELVPLAPRKTKRRDGWSYWVGVNLLDDLDVTPRSLWPSSASRDWKDVGDMNGIPENSWLARRVFHVEQGSALWPIAHGMCVQNSRQAGPSGNELGHRVNEVEREVSALWGTPNAHPRTHTPRRVDHGEQLANQVDDVAAGVRLFPTTTTTTDAKAARNLTSGRSDPDSDHHSGTTLLDALIIDGSVEMPGGGLWPTPSAAAAAQGPGNEGRSGGENIVTRVGSASLNPTWVEFLMGLPLWWTDPGFLFPTQVDWRVEPDLDLIPRVASGVKNRAHRLRAIGNAVFWPCAYYALSRAIPATSLPTQEARENAAA